MSFVCWHSLIFSDETECVHITAGEWDSKILPPSSVTYLALVFSQTVHLVVSDLRVTPQWPVQLLCATSCHQVLSSLSDFSQQSVRCLHRLPPGMFPHTRHVPPPSARPAALPLCVFVYRPQKLVASLPCSACSTAPNAAAVPASSCRVVTPRSASLSWAVLYATEDPVLPS